MWARDWLDSQSQRERQEENPKPPLPLLLTALIPFSAVISDWGNHKTPTYFNLAQGHLHLVEIRVPAGEDQGQIASASPFPFTKAVTKPLSWLGFHKGGVGMERAACYSDTATQRRDSGV